MPITARMRERIIKWHNDHYTVSEIARIVKRPEEEVRTVIREEPIRRNRKSEA